ncbi:MAG: DUF4012 domain-containing protein, partial [Candidatus Shapirobacteria bacterium]|nr:DUF4012 domain-containing protein [Candidatus Shapirobacteria bacterium]
LEPENSSFQGDRKKKRLKKWLIVAGSLFLVVILLVFFLVLPLLQMKKQALVFTAEAKGIYEGLQSQDLNKAVEKVASTKKEFEKLNGQYQKMIWLRAIPFIGGYYHDGQRIFTGGHYLLESADLVVESLQPYADLLGLEGNSQKKEEKEITTEERLVLVLDTLDKIQPNLDKIGEKLDLAQGEIDKINPNRYPQSLFGKKIREKVISLISTIDGTTQTVKEIKPIISHLKPILGVPDQKNYLLLFQNDAELRPTGGFITAYATLSVQNGKFSASNSNDIYTLDDRFGNRLKAPDPILNYHKNVFNWHLRDMNLSPDFKVSMDTFLANYEKVEGTSKFDGVIAVDTKVLVDLLKVLGPIGVSGFGNFSAENDKRCDCPQVFYELERYADQPVTGLKQERKGIIGPLMHSILLNAMGSPRKQWPLFMNVIFNNIAEKHLLFYFFDENIQKTMEALNASGRIKEYNGDYLHVNDCNFAGAKSNMFIRESFDQQIEVAPDGTITKTLTIDYKNPAPPSNCNLEAGELCLNGLYRDWVRVYVPKGSELIEVKGSEVQAKTYEDLGKTVFEAFYGDQSPLRPQGKAQLIFKYKLPFKYDNSQPYKILIQKQPGTYGYENTINFRGKEQNFELKTDKELKF